MDKSLQDAFLRLGLSEKEAATYRMLLEYGQSAAGDLAKKLDLPRTTIYGLLESLAKRGIVLRMESEGAKLWYAQSPDRLLELLQDEVDVAVEIRDALSSQIPALKAIRDINSIRPRFSHFDGIEGVRHVLRDVLLYRDMESLCFWPISEMLQILGDEFMYFHNTQRIRQNISIRGIWPREKQVNISEKIFLGVGKKFKRELRTAPEGIDCSMSYWIYGDKIGFVSSKKECFGFIIESREMRMLMETQFEFIWQQSERIVVASRDTDKFIRDNELS